MSQVTRILQAIEAGDAQAADALLPVVYEELRRLARQRLAQERPGQTLEATALVHEAYLRLVGDRAARWEHSGHFFSAAAEAMRRILIERARRKKRLRHGGGCRRVELEEAMGLGLESEPAVVLGVHEAMENLTKVDPRLAELVKLRCFLGMSISEAAKVMEVTPRTVNRDWVVAKAWLKKELAADGAKDAADSQEK